MPPILFGKPLLSALLFSVLLGAPLQGTAQPEKPLHIADLSYTYEIGVVYDSFNRAEKNFFYPKKRVLFAVNDSIRYRMESIIDQSIRKMWNCTPETAFLRLKSTHHAFKPMAPNETTRENFLFFDVFDDQTPEWNYSFSDSKDWHLTGAVLKMNCKIVTGVSKKPLFSRTMKVIMYRNPIPEGAYGLSKLPGLPDSFMAAFNRAIELFFGPYTPPDSLEFYIPPACPYINLKKEKQVIIPLDISIGNGWVDIRGGTGLSWVVDKISTQKVDKKSYFVQNFLGGLLFNNPTYTTDHWLLNRTPIYFRDDGTSSMVSIPYMERREDQEVSRRKVTGECFYTILNDTIARFGFWHVPEALPLDTARYYWNGADSATIHPMPNSWTNRGLYKPTVVKGVLKGKNFVIQNCNAANMFDITYNGKLIATLQTEDGVPVKGYQYNADLPQDTYRALMVMAMIPFAYYGEY